MEPEITAAAESQAVSTDDIAALAYHLWQDRGCPMGSPEEDWYKAEDLLAAHAPEAGQ
jgi:hypothetical protein